MTFTMVVEITSKADRGGYHASGTAKVDTPDGRVRVTAGHTVTAAEARGGLGAAYAEDKVAAALGALAARAMR
jgi:hypothetical protein